MQNIVSPLFVLTAFLAVGMSAQAQEPPERGKPLPIYTPKPGACYVLLRTHEWSDEIVNRLRGRGDAKRRRLPPRRRRSRY